MRKHENLIFNKVISYNGGLIADTLIRCRTIKNIWLGFDRNSLTCLDKFIYSFSIIPSLEVLYLDFEP